MSKPTELVSLGYDKITAMTPRAILFVFGDDEEWLPKSQITDLDEQLLVVEIPLWLAEKKEIEGYEY